MDNPERNRRRHERLRIDTEYCLVIGDAYPGRLENISLNGAFLRMPENGMPPSLTVKTIGDLKLKVDDEFITLKCRVVYISDAPKGTFPMGLGVEFVKQDTETATLIWNLAVKRGFGPQTFD